MVWGRPGGAADNRPEHVCHRRMVRAGCGALSDSPGRGLPPDDRYGEPDRERVIPDGRIPVGWVRVHRERGRLQQRGQPVLLEVWPGSSPAALLLHRGQPAAARERGQGEELLDPRAVPDSVRSSGARPGRSRGRGRATWPLEREETNPAPAPTSGGDPRETRMVRHRAPEQEPGQRETEGWRIAADEPARRRPAAAEQPGSQAVTDEQSEPSEPALPPVGSALDQGTAGEWQPEAHPEVVPAPGVQLQMLAQDPPAVHVAGPVAPPPAAESVARLRPAPRHTAPARASCDRSPVNGPDRPEEPVAGEVVPVWHA